MFRKRSNKTSSKYNFHKSFSHHVELIEKYKKWCEVPPKDYKEQRDRQIVYYHLYEELNALDIYRKYGNSLISKRGTPMSKRQIQNILKEFDPERSNGQGLKGHGNQNEKYKKNKIRFDAVAQMQQSGVKKVCNNCGRTETETEKLQVDHVRPVMLGGDNSQNNLQYLCKYCHKIKSSSELSFSWWLKRNGIEINNN